MAQDTIKSSIDAEEELLRDALLNYDYQQSLRIKAPLYKAFNSITKSLLVMVNATTCIQCLFFFLKKNSLFVEFLKVIFFATSSAS